MHLTVLNASKDAVLLNIFGELCINNVTRTQDGSVLSRNLAIADGACGAVRKEGGLPEDEARLRT